MGATPLYPPLKTHGKMERHMDDMDRHSAKLQKDKCADLQSERSIMMILCIGYFIKFKF